ncbi:extracellular solute-binding protein [Lactiplantibacillus garii]|uniref:Extracellular solute-binding protein n=1 Tax=Lactiplantibacillus garii TaxID=2306423 RepID=A0A426D8F1_9LACO|nr:extracellular solute-binding protein [Lactiplantibacillus garii]RRK10882.1 extracellular solute-binding protein [Lactiplantibacillus garii]
MSKAPILALSALGILIIGGGAYVANHQSKPATAATAKNQVLTVYAAGPKPLSDKIVKGFEKQSGIKVKTFDGTTGKILSKLKAEDRNPQADVLILASMAAGVDLQNQGKLVTYDAKRVTKLNPKFQDTKHQLFNYSASAVGITYHKTSGQTAPTDWTDLTKSTYKNAVTIPDPKTSGSSLDFINVYQQKHGDSLFKALNQNGADIGGANKEVLDAVVTGQKKAVLGGVDYMSISAIKKGEKIGFAYPKSGTLVNPRPAMILKSSQHQAAAKKFVDYLLSDKVQKQVKAKYLIPGTATELVNPLNGETIKSYDVNWKAANDSLQKNIRTFNRVLKND